MRRVLLGMAVLAAILPALPAAASATMMARPAILIGGRDGSTQSTNWSGYAAYQTGTTFTDVKGTWVQPTATCPNKKRQYSSFWVGIDGYNSSSVEQTGTEADCLGRNRPSYYAWYEMYPSAPVVLSMTIHAGDAISGEVSASGTSFTLTLTNVTTGSTFTTTKTSSTAAKTSAEWVAEAPTGCTFTCRVLPLANFGTVNFSGSYATGNGQTGSISNSAWTHDDITMVTSGGATKALPGPLSPDGTAFSVTWMHS